MRLVVIGDDGKAEKRMLSAFPTRKHAALLPASAPPLVIGFSHRSAIVPHLRKYSDRPIIQPAGIDVWLMLPPQLEVPGCAQSRSETSEARYFLQGSVRQPGDTHYTGILGHYLPAGRRTSCHCHGVIGSVPAANELHFPLDLLGQAMAISYTASTPQGDITRRELPLEGLFLPAGEIHELEAPAECGVYTLVVMSPMPENIGCMKGHRKHPSLAERYVA